MQRRLSWRAERRSQNRSLAFGLRCPWSHARSSRHCHVHSSFRKPHDFPCFLGTDLPSDMSVALRYFSALSRGDPLPVKDRIEMPVATQKTDTGLTQGLLKVLHKQVGGECLCSMSASPDKARPPQGQGTGAPAPLGKASLPGVHLLDVFRAGICCLSASL